MADNIQTETMNVYSLNTAFLVRRNSVTDFELGKWDRLARYINNPNGIRLFDCAFGSGRDLLIAQQRGYDVYGCELSDFLYHDFVCITSICKDHLYRCDMRSIPTADQMFDIVRHNASFVHMPLIAKGYTAHACLDETYRILKSNGLLYICVKEGDGFVSLDTLDGLGSRAFQYYHVGTLQTLLKECGFKAIEINHYEKMRNGKRVCWIEAFANKELIC